MGVGRIFELGDVRILECHPGYALKVDTVVVLQDAARPHHRGYRGGANADTAPDDILRAETTARRVVDDERMRSFRREYDGGNQDQRLAVGFRLQISYQRQFRDVEFQVPHHPFELGVRHLHVVEVENETGRADLPIFQSHYVGMVSQQRLQF